ncbi:MAG: flavodoxin family protein [Halanaeroarchaeum sp.]
MPSEPGPDGPDLAGRQVVVSYSRTGTTRRVADDLVERLASPERLSIEPTTERRYANWLLRSFVPGATVPIEPIRTDLGAADALFLGSPKWTLSCPPVTAFVNRLRAEGVPAGLFVTYGGFDERRFARSLAGRMREAGADLQAKLLVERDAVGGREYESGLEAFLDAVVDG